MPEPGFSEPVHLYDLGEAEPVAIYPGAGCPLTPITLPMSSGRSQAESDSRLEELITWLESSRDKSTERVSATGADPEKAFEAIRSGELANRLSTDKAVMAAYLSAVRDDPAIASFVAEAAVQGAMQDRESAAAAVRSELLAQIKSDLDADYQREKRRQDAELKERERALQKSLEQRVTERGVSLERELENRLGSMRREAEKQAAAQR